MFRTDHEFNLVYMSTKLFTGEPYFDYLALLYITHQRKETQLMYHISLTSVNVSMYDLVCFLYQLKLGLGIN